MNLLVGSTQPRSLLPRSCNSRAAPLSSSIRDQRRLLIRHHQSKMTIVPSYFPNSTHDELLARCHSDRSERVRDHTPKLTSSLDYEPAAGSTDSEMVGFQRCESAEDSAVLARRHSTLRTRSALFDVPKLTSCLDSYTAAQTFVPLPSDAASAAFTPTSSSLDAFRSSSPRFDRLTSWFSRI